MSQKQWSKPPAMQIDLAKSYSATLETSKGTIVIKMSPDHAPITVNNFVFLAKEGFYDGITFHRVISNFMVSAATPRVRAEAAPATGLRMK